MVKITDKELKKFDNFVKKLVIKKAGDKIVTREIFSLAYNEVKDDRVYNNVEFPQNYQNILFNLFLKSNVFEKQNQEKTFIAEVKTNTISDETTSPKNNEIYAKNAEEQLEKEETKRVAQKAKEQQLSKKKKLNEFKKNFTKILLDLNSKYSEDGILFSPMILYSGKTINFYCLNDELISNNFIKNYLTVKPEGVVVSQHKDRMFIELAGQVKQLLIDGFEEKFDGIEKPLAIHKQIMLDDNFTADDLNQIFQGILSTEKFIMMPLKTLQESLNNIVSSRREKINITQNNKSFVINDNIVLDKTLYAEFIAEQRCQVTILHDVGGFHKIQYSPIDKPKEFKKSLRDKIMQIKYPDLKDYRDKDRESMIKFIIDNTKYQDKDQALFINDISLTLWAGNALLRLYNDKSSHQEIDFINSIDDYAIKIEDGPEKTKHIFKMFKEEIDKDQDKKNLAILDDMYDDFVEVEVNKSLSDIEVVEQQQHKL